MNIVGEAAARGSVESAWDALHEAAALARAIPGCEHFEISGPGSGRFIAAIGLPAIGGTYAGTLTIVEQQRPILIRLTASATSDQGTITADVTLRLSASPGSGAATLVSYEANGTVAGPIAGVGTRLLVSAAKRLAGEFFAAIGESEPATVEPSAMATPVPLPRPAPLPRPDPVPGDRTALLAGAAIGLAGVIIGVLAGRRGRRGGRVRR